MPPSSLTPCAAALLPRRRRAGLIHPPSPPPCSPNAALLLHLPDPPACSPDAAALLVSNASQCPTPARHQRRPPARPQRQLLPEGHLQIFPAACRCWLLPGCCLLIVLCRRCLLVFVLTDLIFFGCYYMHLYWTNLSLSPDVCFVFVLDKFYLVHLWLCLMTYMTFELFCLDGMMDAFIL